MRRHAKASTAGSTQRQAERLGRRFFRGVLAFPGALCGSGGSNASAVGRLLLPVSIFTAMLVAMTFMAASAGATRTHLFKETFGSSAQPKFVTPRGVTVDQTTGDVLVIDAGVGAADAPSIKRYHPDGTPANFSALGTNVIDGQGTGDETPQNGLTFGSVNVSQIVVDNSGTVTDGDIYVTQFPSTISIFSSAGEYLGQLSESGGDAFHEVCGVAVDPSGAVYVGDYSSGIHEFVPTANPAVNADYTATFSSVAHPCALATGAGATAGFLFANEYGGSISKLDSATGEVKYVVTSGENQTLTVDPGSGHVYAVARATVKELDASGVASATPVASFTLTQASQEAVTNEVMGVAVRGSTGNVYVPRTGDSTVAVFGTDVTIPDVATGSASSVGPTGATLNGMVNPDGVALSECFFEWGTNTSYDEVIPCVPSAAGVGSGTSPVEVHTDLSGLNPGTVYHYRLKAGNADGAGYGDDMSLQTAGPVIKDTWSENIVRTEARLKAEINPEGVATTYHFEWGTSLAYGSESTESGVGSDSSDHEVSVALNELRPGTTYHYRVVATSALATSKGPDQTLTTYEIFVPNIDCTNQGFRIGFAAALPDCRAYEMVSPVDKNGGEIRTFPTATNYRASYNRSASSGSRVTYSSHMAFGDAPSGHYSNQYLATRRPDGWSTSAIGAPQGTTIFDPEFAFFLDFDTQFEAFTEDLSSAWLRDFNRVPLTTDGIEGYANIYRQDTSSGSYEALTVNPPIGPAPKTLGNLCCRSVEAQGISADGSHVVLSANARLTPDAAASEKRQLYDFHDGELHLASVLPGGAANQGDSDLGSDFEGDVGGLRRLAIRTRALSEDGSRIFWTSPNPHRSDGFGKIYARIDGETTVPISELETSRFWAASSDGSKALFQVGTSLTASDLYVSDVDAETATLIAGEIYGVLGSSDDLSYLYFVSNEDLSGGATAGERNLYLYHEGVVTFIATLSRVDTNEPASGEVSGYSIAGPNALRHASRVTPDGRHIAFQSIRSLTGYDNTAENGEPALEVFTYDADAERLTCASCNPSGARPVTKPYQTPMSWIGDGPETNNGSGHRPTAAWLTTSENANYTPRSLSADGSRLFFNAFDALVVGDTNGAQDVYEWEAHGSGDCHKANGCISLISTGQNPGRSEFVDASADGSDVFFETESGLDPRDPGLLDIYDARAGGGYPLPPTPTPCIGDACQSVPAAPNDATPASAGFRGAGNPAPRRDCAATARRAAKLNRTAKQMHRRAKRISSEGQARHLQKDSARLAKQAKRLGKSVARCRRTHRGAGR